jgi:hypothetical protein
MINEPCVLLVDKAGKGKRGREGNVKRHSQQAISVSFRPEIRVSSKRNNGMSTPRNAFRGFRRSVGGSTDMGPFISIDHCCASLADDLSAPDDLEDVAAFAQKPGYKKNAQVASRRTTG